MNLSGLNFQDILNILPHRYPFLLVDRIKEIIPGKSIKGVKNISYNEPQFTGHFPENPVMPGVLMIESMAQMSGILIAKTLNADTKGKLMYLISIDNCKFKKIVSPGDILNIKVEFIQTKMDLWKFKGSGYVDEKMVFESDFCVMLKKNQ